MNASTYTAVPAGVALYMAVVQFLFFSTWTIYVVFLPKLLEGAGLPVSLAPAILIVDQLVFMATDIYAGVAADRAQKTLGRVGPLIVGMTALSCVAFLLLPHLGATVGAAAPAAMLSLLLVWAATSSALRAPPWVLLSKYAAAPSLPRLNTLMLCGLAVGGAAAPYLGVVLKNVDPRLPFALSSLSLLAATAGIVYVERRLQLKQAVRPPTAAEAADAAGKSGLFLLGVLLMALGFQIHFSINSTPQYLRFAQAESLEWLMPVFWLGFAVGMMPGSVLCKRFGTLRVMTLAALGGALAACAASAAGSLGLLIAAQFAAGGAWGSMLMCAFTAATAAGRTGREGFALGLMFAMLATATLGRMAIAVSGLPKQPDFAGGLSWAPVFCWLGGALAVGMLAWRRAAIR
jgi:MFS family permease